MSDFHHTSSENVKTFQRRPKTLKRKKINSSISESSDDESNFKDLISRREKIEASRAT